MASDDVAVVEFETSESIITALSSSFAVNEEAIRKKTACLVILELHRENLGL
jgi:hypothetical protein